MWTLCGRLAAAAWLAAAIASAEPAASSHAHGGGGGSGGVSASAAAPPPVPSHPPPPVPSPPPPPPPPPPPTIPVLDMALGERAFAAALRRAAHEVGFFYLVNHDLAVAEDDDDSGPVSTKGCKSSHDCAGASGDDNEQR